MSSYSLWFHERLGPYAVRTERGRVTGVCGPLHLLRAADCQPAAFDYDDREESIRLFQLCPEQFCLMDRWWHGEWAAPIERPKLRPVEALGMVGVWLAAVPLILIGAVAAAFMGQAERESDSGFGV